MRKKQPDPTNRGLQFRGLPGLEASIRTLSVSLLAVAAIAASLVLSRNEGTSAAGSIPAGETLPGAPSLDKIRAAGL
jgi:hypothetical protein